MANCESYYKDRTEWNCYAKGDNSDYKITVEQPPHYTQHPSGVECITITRHMPFCLGNAVKYIWRCEHKGRKKQDLEKAIQYLKYEIENMEERDEA